LPERETSKELKLGRRLLEDIVGYERLNDFIWDDNINQWHLIARLTIDTVQSDLVPPSTEWHIFVDDEYPRGSINFFPDADKGIKYTFHHQNYNRLREGIKWRDGKVCLDTTQGSWGRKRYSTEPFHARTRLRWHVERCLMWLVAAATDTLAEVGDPFELPDYPDATSFRFVFNEDNHSFEKWQNREERSGLFTYCGLGHQSETYPITSFFPPWEDNSDNFWGKYIQEKGQKQKTGAWIMLSDIPIIKPWQMASNFKELSNVCLDQGIDLFNTILRAYTKLQRKRLVLNVVILGFPVSSSIGGTKELIHWFAFEVPRAPKVTGFRDNETLWKRQVSILLSPNNIINWIKTENWNEAQLTSRGRVDQGLRDSRILFIGAGALSATFSEVFGRLGCKNLTIIDFDKFHAGNLSRHTLTVKDVGKNKAEALSRHLNSLFPFQRVDFRNMSINTIFSKQHGFLDDFDVVIDATAEDEVIELLSNQPSPKNSHFFSVSTGYNAERLYCYMRPGSETNNLKDDFERRMATWLQKESETARGESEIIEGIGCWHPLFPARIDDIQMLVGAAFKVIEKHFLTGAGTQLSVVEKKYDDRGDFAGIGINND
jgi:hypothetical protein